MAVGVRCHRKGVGGGSSSCLSCLSCLSSLGRFRCVWTLGGSLAPVERHVEGLPRGALSACDSGGLEDSLQAPWGVLWVYFWGVGLSCHEDPMCPVEDPPLGVRFEDVDGGMLGWCVEGVPRCDRYFNSGGVEVQRGPAAEKLMDMEGGDRVFWALQCWSHRWNSSVVPVLFVGGESV